MPIGNLSNRTVLTKSARKNNRSAKKIGFAIIVFEDIGIILSERFINVNNLMLKKKIIVVMPAFNAERTLEKVYRSIPKGIIDKVLLIDDCSTDQTVELAKKLGIETIVHKKNLGYGANQKTCYKESLKRGADFVIMLHPDGQYDAFELPLFVKALQKGDSDLILGSRFLGGHHQTPLYKSVSIRFITFLFNLVLGTRLTEANTGYRGFTKKFLQTVPYAKNGSGYIFDPQIIIQAVYLGFKIKEVPVTKGYSDEASSPNFSKSVNHGIENLQLLIQYMLHVFKIKKAAYLSS